MPLTEIWYFLVWDMFSTVCRVLINTTVCLFLYACWTDRWNSIDKKGKKTKKCLPTKVKFERYQLSHRYHSTQIVYGYNTDIFFVRLPKCTLICTLIEQFPHEILCQPIFVKKSQTKRNKVLFSLVSKLMGLQYILQYNNCERFMCTENIAIVEMVYWNHNRNSRNSSNDSCDGWISNEMFFQNSRTISSVADENPQFSAICVCMCVKIWYKIENATMVCDYRMRMSLKYF